MLPQRGGDAAVELQAQRQEVVGVTGAEHLQLELELPVLGAQQVGERPVLDRRHVDRGQLLLQHLGLVGELAVGEGRLGDLAGQERLLHVVTVDRGDVQQEAEALRHLGELAVDREVRGGEGPGVGVGVGVGVEVTEGGVHGAPQARSASDFSSTGTVVASA